MTTFTIANTMEHYRIISDMAKLIWMTHYTPIIGETASTYMTTTYQSVAAIEEQVEEGSLYYFIEFEGKPVGYFAIREEGDALFLSKIYVLSAYRGKKLGKEAMLFIEAKAREFHLKTIRLIVNIKNTDTVKAYEKWGFVKIDKVVTDFGNGFLMDDYKMKKVLKLD